MFFLFFHIITPYYSISKAHARNAVKMEPGHSGEGPRYSAPFLTRF
jgi:hypothetical protein